MSTWEQRNVPPWDARGKTARWETARRPKLAAIRIDTLPAGCIGRWEGERDATVDERVECWSRMGEGDKRRLRELSERFGDMVLLAEDPKC